MRYMVMLTMRSDVGPPPPGLVEAMDVAMGEAVGSGLLIDAGGLMGDHGLVGGGRHRTIMRSAGPPRGR